MCYCCGSILWSRVDNCHMNLVDIQIDDKSIPVIAYQKVLYQNNGTMLLSCHKSGKLYACSVCKLFKSPTELKTDFHVGKVTENGKILSVDKWDMAYPN